MLRRIIKRLPVAVHRGLYEGGQRSDRLRDPNGVVAALVLRPGDRLTDVARGYGHFTLRLAQAVAAGGNCYAADADAATLEALRAEAEQRGLTNLRPVLTSARRLDLPEPVDLLFVSATYPHLRRPVHYFAEARPL